MKTITAMLGALAFAATAAAADVVPPQDVVYGEYGEIEQSLTGKPGDAEKGLEVYSSRSQGNCVACHSVSALLETVAWHGNVGPSLDGVAGRWSEAELRGIVANAKNVYDGTIMPAFYKSSGYIRPGVGFTRKPATEPLPPLLTAEQIEDVVAYLLTLQE